MTELLYRAATENEVCNSYSAAEQRWVVPFEPDYEAASDLLVMFVNSGVDLSTETWRLIARDVVNAALRGGHR